MSANDKPEQPTSPTSPPASTEAASLQGRRILLCISGGIAAYKACELIRELTREGAEVRVVATRGALEFVTPLTLQTLSGHPVRTELFSLDAESEISHIELADWAELVILAPATAHTLARLVHGLADDLLTTVCLATRAPLLVAPAMNVNMYRHPATQENLAVLAKRGVRIEGPDRGDLACGWEGEGRLVEPARIAAAAERMLRSQDLAGEVVVITAGPTAEPLDPVRVLTNRSSGRMGFALAEDAVARGAEVLLVAGPVSLPTPFGVERIDVETTREMHDAVLDSLERATIVIKAAAVSDYRPAEASERKIKREGKESLELSLVANPDISAAVGQRKGTRTVVAFAAETDRLIEYAAKKRRQKGADLIVANDVSRSDIGFSVDRNEVTILGPTDDDVVQIGPASKREVAAGILDRIVEVRS